MAKAISSDKKKPEQEDQQKTRKKEAKKEAKLMLQIEQAKKDVRKAEQKAAKVQANVQELQAHLQKLQEELGHFRHTDQETKVEPVASTTSGDVQASLQAEDRSDLDAPAAASSEASPVAGVDSTDAQPSLLFPTTDRDDITEEDATPAGTTSTPIENIPAEQSAETAGGQVHADISVAPAEEDLTIDSGDGSIPVVTQDENAWPPTQIREELAESIAEEATQQPSAAIQNEEVNQQPPTATQNEHAEENLTIASGDGSIPVVTSDENAWPPTQIREELAESIAEEVAQESAASSNRQGATDGHEGEHEVSSGGSRRSTRRRTHTHKNTDEA